MELTRRSDYALRIIKAAYENRGNYISVSDIAESQNIPYPFARSIQHDLVQSGILKTVRGAKGGAMLNCDPDKTTLYEVLTLLQGSICISPCSEDHEYCERCGGCEFHVVWKKIDHLLENILSSITLSEMFDGDALENVSFNEL